MDMMVAIDDIQVGTNVRTRLGNLESLVESIKRYGVIEPLVVTPTLYLIAGHRRLEAARRAGLSQVPVRILEINSPLERVVLALVENHERAELDPLSRAHTYRWLLDNGATVEEVAHMVGAGPQHVYQYLELLDLDPRVQEALYARKISFSDARALASLPPEGQREILDQIEAAPGPVSSRAVARMVKVYRSMMGARQRAESDSDPDPGMYNVLFFPSTSPASQNIDIRRELERIITEMLAASQGEDQLRDWARRLSRLMGVL